MTGVSIELPLARAIAAGLGRSRALAVIPLLARDGHARDEARAVVGGRIEVYENEHEEGGHIVQAVFALREATETEPGHALDDGVFWDNLSVVARGRVLPETALALCAGRPLRTVVDHPFLEGVAITDASNHGSEALVLEAEDAMVPCAMLEGLL